MKICIVGAPSTGKSVFAKQLAAQMSMEGMSCELVQEYASAYIQHVGTPVHMWEQLAISVGQQMAESHTTREYMITDTAAFMAYIYAQETPPASEEDRKRHQHVIDLLRTLARTSVQSYDHIFFMERIYPPKSDGVRLNQHISKETCQSINSSISSYLASEGIRYIAIDSKSQDSVSVALHHIKTSSHVLS